MRQWTKGMMTALVAGSLALGRLPALAQGTNGPGIDAREARQQGRLNQGVESGRLTHGEYNHPERQQGHIQAAEARMKADGNFTPREGARVERRLNHSSRHIYRAKHHRRLAGAHCPRLPAGIFREGRGIFGRQPLPSLKPLPHKR
jgi:hypothetical protein